MNLPPKLAAYNRLRQLKNLIDSLSLLSESETSDILECLEGNVLSEEDCGAIRRMMENKEWV